MLYRDVLALDVTNLSDARYFSAKGVRWIAFPIARDFDNIQTIKEMLSWIAGPEAMLHSLDGDAAYAKWLSEEVGVNKIMVNTEDLDSFESFQKGNIVPFIGQDLPTDLSNYNQAVLEVEEYNDYQKVTPGDILFPATEKIKELAENNEDLALAIKGGEEEKPGLKNYEALDKILAHLEEED